MQLKGILTDRKLLVAAIAEETGIEPEYCGAPTFQYKIGAYHILRDGTLEVSDGDADEQILLRLAEKGLVEKLEDKDEGAIVFYIKDYPGHTPINVVNTIAAREKLINKAVGKENAFHVSTALMRLIKKENPADANELTDLIFQCGNENALKGLCITPEKIVFTGFPGEKTEDTHFALAERIVETAAAKKWMKSDMVKVENEKYSFRVWLISIGMVGKTYSKAREELLRPLAGNTAFKTDEQQKLFNQSRKRTRRTATKEDEDFILL